MHIEPYSEKYTNEIIALILDIQNTEARIALPLSEQPDLLDIPRYYRQGGGEFFVAVSDGKVIGTIGLMVREQHCAILKKFFVHRDFRAQGIGLTLYSELLRHAKRQGVQHIFLDTPSVARVSHRFYEKAGFHRIRAEELPIAYSYPDRNSLLYRLDI